MELYFVKTNRKIVCKITKKEKNQKKYLLNCCQYDMMFSEIELIHSFNAEEGCANSFIFYVSIKI